MLIFSLEREVICMNIIVTGGSRGIGRCLVQNLARDGHNVLLNYNKSDKQAKNLQEVLRE